MTKIVKVSLLHPQGLRLEKGGPVIEYARGIQKMPLEHAQIMGLTHRIVGEVEETAAGQEAPAVTRLPFEGAFDEKLTKSLTNAGFKTLADLARASQDQLMAVDGVGPAAYERIRAAISTGQPAAGQEK